MFTAAKGSYLRPREGARHARQGCGIEKGEFCPDYLVICAIASRPRIVGFCSTRSDAHMPNIGTAIKDEISRIARKEIRFETQKLKKQSAHYRSQIASLKRQIVALDKQVRTGSNSRKAVKAAPEGAERAPDGLRFRAKGFAAHRRRLGLSAVQAGALLGVSGQSIYHWESGKSRPRASQMPAISALRKLSKTQAAAAVAQVIG